MDFYSLCLLMFLTLYAYMLVTKINIRNINIYKFTCPKICFFRFLWYNKYMYEYFYIIYYWEGYLFYAVIYCTYSFGTLLRKPQGILECSHDPLRIWMYLLLYHDDFLYYTSYLLGDYTLPDSSRRCSFPSSVF